MSDIYKETILLKLGEIVLKGGNRRAFEQKLVQNVRKRLKSIGEFDISSMQSTVYIKPKEGQGAAAMDEVVRAVKQIYGIAVINKAAESEKDIEKLAELAANYCKEELLAAKTFRVEARRSDKSFPMTSPEIAAHIGAHLLQKFPSLQVDLENPQITIGAEIRDKAAYIHSNRIAGAGGLPVGMSGRALLLLSGGIDSPVAGHMMAKRGVELAAIHFESPPYTSPRSTRKVADLAKAMSRRCGYIRLFTADAAQAMLKIRESCPMELFTVILRRFMVRTACIIAQNEGCSALVTGESLGQVASQTMEALQVTEEASDRLIFRPLIGLDKEEIVTIARQTETFDISSRPYEDCCTVFTPRHPELRPRLAQVLEAESALCMEELCEEAAKNARRWVFD